MIGIVGNGRDKFTDEGYKRATDIVYKLIGSTQELICSGNSPMLGIDYLVKSLTPENRYIEYSPLNQIWEPHGYKERNIEIAKSEIVYVLVADNYPKDYKGQKFLYPNGNPMCYHCEKREKYNHPIHVKSGACWTGYKAIEFHNKAEWIVIKN